MPSDEMVEKVARAIYEARGAHEPPRAWRKWEDIGDEARAVWCQCATAALSAAHAEPVARDPSRFSRLSPDEPPVIRERPDPTLGFISTAEMLASPSEAAIRADERAAIRKEAFEEAAKIARIEAAQCASLGCTHPENSETRDRLFARARAADAIATAIRARGET